MVGLNLQKLLFIFAAAVFVCFFLHPTMGAVMVFPYLNQTLTNHLTHTIMYVYSHARAEVQVCNSYYGRDQAVQNALFYPLKIHEILIIIMPLLSATTLGEYSFY